MPRSPEDNFSSQVARWHPLTLYNKVKECPNGNIRCFIYHNYMKTAHGKPLNKYFLNFKYYDLNKTEKNKLSKFSSLFLPETFSLYLSTFTEVENPEVGRK